MCDTCQHCSTHASTVNDDVDAHILRYIILDHFTGIAPTLFSLISGMIYIHASGQAKNKSWFGVMEAYDMLDSCWTILSETSQFAQVMLQNLEADQWDVDDDDDEAAFF